MLEFEVRDVLSADTSVWSGRICLTVLGPERSFQFVEKAEMADG